MAALDCSSVVFSFAEVLYVVPFTYSTNDDYSDAVQACSKQFMPAASREQSALQCECECPGGAASTPSDACF